MYIGYFLGHGNNYYNSFNVFYLYNILFLESKSLLNYPFVVQYLL